MAEPFSQAADTVGEEGRQLSGNAASGLCLDNLQAGWAVLTLHAGGGSQPQMQVYRF